MCRVLELAKEEQGIHLTEGARCFPMGKQLWSLAHRAHSTLGHGVGVDYNRLNMARIQLKENEGFFCTDCSQAGDCWWIQKRMVSQVWWFQQKDLGFEASWDYIKNGGEGGDEKKRWRRLHG